MDYTQSPVEADKYLAPGEKPFTAFGQYGVGNLDIRVFLQDRYWVNISGKPFLLEEMSLDYLNAVLKMLFINATFYHAAISKWYSIELLSIGTGATNPPWDYIENTGMKAREVLDSQPVEWLRETLLAKKLLSLIDSKDI